MSDRRHGDGGPPGQEAHGESPTSYAAYTSARERFLERLRVDSEVRRLESMWQCPAAARRAPEEGGGA